MELARFWQIIDAAHKESQGSMDAACDSIRRAVSALSADEARAFSAHFDARMDEAYTWPLWGAAYVLRGGCSDDGFTDFRSVLISQGRAVFEAALADPESLAGLKIPDEDWDYEGFQYAVSDGVESACGESPPRANPYPEEPSGEEWDEDEVESLFPKLAARAAGEAPARPPSKESGKKGCSLVLFAGLAVVAETARRLL